MYHKRGLWAIKAKNGGVFPRHDAQPKAPAPAAKAPKFYPANDVKKPLVNKRKPKPTKLRNSNSKNPILHRSLNLIHLHILRQPETPHELATAPLDTMPRVILVFLLYLPLSTNPNHSVIFDLDFHFLLV
ncbi:60s ribosomal protein l6-1 [Quercus suber]|uniref:60s ribosomal protein l6-1 n=1 Tax=Quercus suber TaxID=58331 RepID=A0AAW0KYQ1_QUESU